MKDAKEIIAETDTPNIQEEESSIPTNTDITPNASSPQDNPVDLEKNSAEFHEDLAQAGGEKYPKAKEAELDTTQKPVESKSAASKTKESLESTQSQKPIQEQSEIEQPTERTEKNIASSETKEVETDSTQESIASKPAIVKSEASQELTSVNELRQEQPEVTIPSEHKEKEIEHSDRPKGEIPKKTPSTQEEKEQIQSADKQEALQQESSLLDSEEALPSSKSKEAKILSDPEESPSKPEIPELTNKPAAPDSLQDSRKTADSIDESTKTQEVNAPEASKTERLASEPSKQSKDSGLKDAKEAVEQSESIPPEEALLSSNIRQPGMPYKPTKEWPTGTSFYVYNAGVVLIHPFLSHFFKHLNLVNRDSFVDIIAEHKAVHLIQYLATKDLGLPEYELLLPKFLCGIPFDVPIEREIALSEEELEEAENLLAVAIKHWGALGDVSSDALREGFLQREGKFEKRQNGWYLMVEQKTIDILLGKLPWNLSMLKLPWMQELLRVEWH